jgi:hypothetical protein
VVATADVIPPDTRAAGQSGHLADHNNIADVLTALQNLVNSILTAGLVTTGSVDMSLAGQGIRVAEGINAKQGTTVLVGGTRVVANTSVTASSRIQLTAQAPGGTPGALYVSARTPGTSFTVSSTSAADTSTVAYFITEPG